MKQLRLSDFAPSESHNFSPTNIFVIQAASSRLSPDISIYHLHQPPPPSNTSISAKDASAAIADSTPTYTITRPSILRRRFECRDHTGAALARMTSPLRALGRWTLDLPTASSSHAVEMRPTGMSSSADVFVHESIPYFWEVRDEAAAEGGRGWTLHKAVDGRRFVVAKFRGESAHSVAGVLVIDGEECNGLLAVATCVCILKRLDSFRK